MSVGDSEKQLSPDAQDKIVKRAHESFKRYMKYEGSFRDSFRNDVMFNAGDSDNRWQWDDMLTATRDQDEKPSLTINKTRVHCALVVNEIRKHPPAITVRPTGVGSTSASAKIWGGLIREIGRVSNATAIYVKAGESLVQGGVGYWRVLTEYENEKSFDQVIRIRSVKSPMGVALDPEAKEPDGADSNWGMIFEDVLNDTIEDEYPKSKDQIGTTNAVQTNEGLSWITAEHTRVAEYYEREKYMDWLVGYTVDGKEKTEFLSDIPAELRSEILKKPTARKRRQVRGKIMWYKIVGRKVVDSRRIPGKYIPIVRVIGEETVVDGVLDRKGMVRNLKDPQRNLNYWTSAATEQVALQTKVPWVGPAAAFEGHPEWSNANTMNYSFLPYNHQDDQEKPLPAPVRAQPPQLAQAYVVGVQIADQQLNDISGQHEPNQGKEDNADSGRAIIARKVAGELSTYHYPDALAQGVAYTGRIIISMFPEVYDTPRQVRMTEQDGQQNEVNLNPDMQEASKEQDKPDEPETKETEFNPNIGEHEVEAQAGPDYATQRQWAVEAMTQVIGNNQQLWQVFGDLLIQNMDFPGADEMAERMRRTIPKNILGEGPSPQEEQLQQQLQQMQKIIQNMITSMGELQQKLDNKDEEMTIKAVDSETKRIKELGNAQANYEAAGEGDEIKKLMVEATGDALAEPDVGQGETKPDEPPHPDARKGEDGHWYAEHPEQPGAYMRHVPEGAPMQ